MSGIRLTEQGQGRELLKKHCRKAGVPVDVVTRLIDVELEHVGRARRHDLFTQFDEIIGEVVDGELDVSEKDSAA